MADSADRPGIFSRIASVFRPSVKESAPTPASPPAVEVKAADSLLPRYTIGGGFNPAFVPLNARSEVISLLGESGLAFVAYWYVATRWRAQKLSEAPLMVVEEDQDTGAEEWLSDHELAGVLEDPSLDYDMGDLIERTSRYLDDGAQALWVMDRDGVGRVARLTPFRKSEFEVVARPGRIYGAFKVTTDAGVKTFEAEQCVFFRDSVEGWSKGARSRLDVALSWLRLGEVARQTVRDLLDNAVWPSLVSIPDASWNPDKDMLELYKSELQQYAQPGERGKAFAMMGGGSAEVLSARIRDLVPTEVLDRVESVVAAVSGVPAIVLQYQVGLENSPWSQMEQARKMAYADTIVPTWRKLERALTRQMLRPDDEDLTHFVRFDRSKIESLQADQLEAATIATMWGRAASLNERREKMGLEPVSAEEDPEGAADEIPELTTPVPSPFGGGDPNADNSDNADDSNATPAEKALRRRRRQKKVSALHVALRNEAVGGFQHVANRLLTEDALEIERIVRNNLSDEKAEKSDRGRSRVMTLITAYLDKESTPRWAKATHPLVLLGSERAVAVIAADVGINFNLLHPHVLKFAQKEVGWLVKGISETTRQSVADTIAAGLEAGKGAADIGRMVSNAGGFSISRARLIARTESTRASAGAPTESLKSYAKASGRRYTKTWSGALDDRERDEHVAMEGETVDIDEKFSNGLDYPSEPNCRCVPIFSEVEA